MRSAPAPELQHSASSSELACSASTPVHIAHVIYRLDIGGLENGLINLINQLPSRFRHSIICLTDDTDFRSRIRRDSVHIFALNKKEGHDLGVYFKLWRLLRRLRPDIVHTRNLGTLDCVPVAAFAGVPCRIHGEHGWDVIDLYGTKRKYMILRQLSQRFMTRHVVVSEDLGRWLAGAVGADQSKVVHICNGVDTNRFQPGHSRHDYPRGFADNRQFVIGTVGRMEPVKDPLTLVRAFVNLLESTPELRSRLRLVIVGDGNEKPAVERMLAEHNAQELIWLPGRRDDIATLLQGFDLFVLPSLNEGISNTILEAMATGLPIVATDVGGNPELVDHGKTGVLVPASDPAAMAAAIIRYVFDSSRVQEHGKAARECAVKQFGLDRMVARYAELYDESLPRTHRKTAVKSH